MQSNAMPSLDSSFGQSFVSFTSRIQEKREASVRLAKKLCPVGMATWRASKLTIAESSTLCASGGGVKQQRHQSLYTRTWQRVPHHSAATRRAQGRRRRQLPWRRFRHPGRHRQAAALRAPRCAHPPQLLPPALTSHLSLGPCLLPRPLRHLQCRLCALARPAPEGPAIGSVAMAAARSLPPTGRLWPLKVGLLARSLPSSSKRLAGGSMCPFAVPNPEPEAPLVPLATRRSLPWTSKW